MAIKHFLLGAALLCSLQGFSQHNFTVEGTLATPARVYLIYKVDNKRTIDSADVKDGHFTISGHVAGPTPASISINHQRAFFYLDKGTTLMNGWPDAVFTGTDICKTFNEFTAIEADNSKLADFIRKYPASVISVNALNTLAFAASTPEDFKKVRALTQHLSPSLKKTDSYQSFDKELTVMASMAKGLPAPVFTQPDSSGKLVSLKDFSGKYVLVDFWASWCEPCRAENPSVVKAMDTYKDKGFTVVSISLDTNRDSWLKAVKEDHLGWTQLSDLSAGNNAAKMYHVVGIPANCLVGPDGKIVAKDLHGDELTKQLEKILGH